MTMYLCSYNIAYVVGKISKIAPPPSDTYPCIAPSPLSVGGISEYDKLSLPGLYYIIWHKGDDAGFPL